MKTKTSVVSLLGLLATSLLAAEPIISFEAGEAWRERVRPGSVKLEIVPEHAVHGQHSARAFLPGSDHDTWPGFEIVLRPEDYADGINELSFSVWHEEDDTMHLNWRLDFKEGQPSFRGGNIPPKTRKRIALTIDRKDADGNSNRATKVVLYRRMPGKTAPSGSMTSNSARPTGNSRRLTTSPRRAAARQRRPSRRPASSSSSGTGRNTCSRTPSPCRPTTSQS